MDKEKFVREKFPALFEECNEAGVEFVIVADVGNSNIAMTSNIKEFGKALSMYTGFLVEVVETPEERQKLIKGLRKLLRELVNEEDKAWTKPR